MTQNVEVLCEFEAEIGELENVFSHNELKRQKVYA